VVNTPVAMDAKMLVQDVSTPVKELARILVQDVGTPVKELARILVMGLHANQCSKAAKKSL